MINFEPFSDPCFEKYKQRYIPMLIRFPSIKMSRNLLQVIQLSMQIRSIIYIIQLYS
jgi:hypothetical protein